MMKTYQHVTREEAAEIVAPILQWAERVMNDRRLRPRRDHADVASAIAVLSSEPTEDSRVGAYSTIPWPTTVVEFAGEISAALIRSLREAGAPTSEIERVRSEKQEAVGRCLDVVRRCRPGLIPIGH